tara:strand:+ start:2061 stop:2774 length:714 start_codon:yes stop_codon:yes gene_type:complete
MINVNIYPKEQWLQPVVNVYPPAPSNKFLPEWYKKNVKTDNPNVRHASTCPAIQKYMTDGLVIRAWSDLIYWKGLGTMKFDLVIGDNTFNNEYEWLATHTQQQVEDMELYDLKEGGVLKLVTPYLFETPAGYGLEFIDAFYHIRHKIRLLPAKVETDIWHEANFVFDFAVPPEYFHDGEVLIKAGDPICMAVPYKKDIKTKVHINKYDEDFDMKHRENYVLNGSKGHVWKEYKKNRK